jgi:hypothetical protein
MESAIRLSALFKQSPRLLYQLLPAFSNPLATILAVISSNTMKHVPGCHCKLQRL